MSGLSLEELSKGAERKEVMVRAGLGSVFFVMGFSLVFTLMGASASTVGQFLSQYMHVASKVASALIILFGLHTIGILPVKWLFYEKRFNFQKVRSGWIGSFLIGLAFAFGWTPCIGPILAGNSGIGCHPGDSGTGDVSPDSVYARAAL